MYLHIGNSNAIEGYRDPTSSDPEKVRYMALEGQRVTEVVFPEGISPHEALLTVLDLLGRHMAPGTTPDWVESDSSLLTGLLAEHFNLSEGQRTRPEGWGTSGSTEGE